MQLQVTNPDNIWLRDTIAAVKWLGLAFFFTGERRYAEQARERAITFFVDEELGMLPNLDFAQSIPGVIDGRSQVCARLLLEATNAAQPV